MDLATVRQRLADLWGAVPVAEVYVEHHERVVFRTVTPSGVRVVVKGFSDPTKLDAERVALRAAGSAGIPVPTVLRHLPGVLVLSWLDGEPLLSTSPARYWAAAGETLCRLHHDAAPDGVPGFGGSDDWCGWFQGWLPEARQRTRELLPVPVAERLSRVLEAGYAMLGAPPKRLLHGDCTSIHWRIRDDGVAGMLDLGDACVGDPVWDLVVLTHWDAQRLPVVLDGYRAGPELRERVHRLFQPYRVTRHLLAVDWLLGHGYDPGPTIRELTRLANDAGISRTGQIRSGWARKGD
ncbi:MAG TPA: aminoglycoside phosphotransferase family protein [Micromonosporaceae bacterium]|nr:aminoglycoside phosphotransferase family protein [Micromonosporaceae bacterium]